MIVYFLSGHRTLNLPTVTPFLHLLLLSLHVSPRSHLDTFLYTLPVLSLLSPPFLSLLSPVPVWLFVLVIMAPRVDVGGLIPGPGTGSPNLHPSVFDPSFDLPRTFSPDLP